jgi:putative transposase
VLLRLPYLALTSVFVFIRLLPMSDMDKDIEILMLHHQFAVLQRQFDKPRLTGRSWPPFCTGYRGRSCGSCT